MSGSKVKILLIDDHEVVRRGLRAMIEADGNFLVCGEAPDGVAGVDLAHKLRPDVVIMDIGMPGLNGFEATRQLLKKSPRSEVLILSMHHSEHVVRESLLAGARGYVLKSDAARDLIVAIEALSCHNSFFSACITDLVHQTYLKEFSANSRPSKHPNELTPRERQIMQLLAEGNSNKDVGMLLKISVKTAETHRARIMRKLQIDSVADLVRYCIRNHVIEP